jgi:hypothetical protein
MIMKEIEALARKHEAHFEDWGNDQPVEIIFYGGLPQLKAFADELTKPQEAKKIGNIYNPWRKFVENVIKGDNYFRTGEYYELLEYIDSLYTAPPNYEALQKENERLREALTKVNQDINVLASLAKHTNDCKSNFPLPDGYGFWDCTCGYDGLVSGGGYENQHIIDEALAKDKP